MIPVSMKFNFNWLSVNLILLSFLLFVFSCSDDDPGKEDQFLVNYSKKLDLTQKVAQDLVNLYGENDMAEKLTHAMKVYRITYNTTYFNESITASGVVALPVDYGESLPVISAYRGTIFADSEAPSLTALVYGFELLASAGYAVVMPDMIGFGESQRGLFP